MGITHVSAATRDARRRTSTVRRLSERHAVLAITSVVAALAIGLAYSGRLAAQRHTETPQHHNRPINLNVVTGADDLEPVFHSIFSSPHERRVATERVLHFIVSVRQSGHTLPNVGAILGPPSRQSRYGEAGAKSAESVPVLTSSQLATVKPSF